MDLYMIIRFHTGDSDIRSFRWQSIYSNHVACRLRVVGYEGRVRCGFNSTVNWFMDIPVGRPAHHAFKVVLNLNKFQRHVEVLNSHFVVLRTYVRSATILAVDGGSVWSFCLFVEWITSTTHDAFHQTFPFAELPSVHSIHNTQPSSRSVRTTLDKSSDTWPSDQ